MFICSSPAKQIVCICIITNPIQVSYTQTHCFETHKAKTYLAKKISLCLVLMKINFLAHCYEKKSRKCVKKKNRTKCRPPIFFFIYGDDNYIPWKAVGGRWSTRAKTFHA